MENGTIRPVQNPLDTVAIAHPPPAIIRIGKKMGDRAKAVAAGVKMKMAKAMSPPTMARLRISCLDVRQLRSSRGRVMSRREGDRAT